MGRFMITFYSPDEHGQLKDVASTSSDGVDNVEAAKAAFKELSPKHPEIKNNLWISVGPPR